MSAHQSNRPPRPAPANRYRPSTLATLVRPARLYYFPRLGSTNTYAIDLRRKGDLFAPSLVLTAQQTGGRGRGSNAWWSACGNMTATWVIPVEEHYAPSQLPLIVGLALRGACTELTGDTGIGIKWPNDLLWQGRKLAGILCERFDNADFIGIGLNVNITADQWPAELGKRVVSLATIAGRFFDLNDVVPLVTTHLRRYLTGRTSRPFAAMLQEYRACDALLGREVHADVPGNTALLSGTCEGVDQEGALLLRSGGRLHHLIAGSINLAHPRP